MYFIQQLINGICQGSIYAMVAIGFTVIAGVLGMVAFCYGETVMFGAYIAYLVFSSVGATMWAFPISIAVMIVFGMILHKVCYEPFFEHPRISLMCTIAAGTIVKNLVIFFTRGETKPVPQIFGNGYIMVGGLQIGYIQLAIITIVVFICAVFSVFLNKTRMGVQLRAVSQNKKAAALLGMNVGNVTMLGNVLGCTFGGIAGILFSVYYSSFYASMGDKISMKAFSASVLGGLSDLSVSAVGGYTVSIAENFGIAVIPSGFRDVIAFVFLILVLVFMPAGLSDTLRKIQIHRQQKKAQKTRA